MLYIHIFLFIRPVTHTIFIVRPCMLHIFPNMYLVGSLVQPMTSLNTMKPEAN